MSEVGNSFLPALTDTRRQITLNINAIDAPQITVTQDIVTTEVGPYMTIADLKGHIEGDTSVSSALQRIYFEGQELFDDSKTLEQCQVIDGSFLSLVARNLDRPTAGSGRPMQTQGRGAPDPETTRLLIMGDPAALAQIRAQNPELAAAKDDPARFLQIWEEMQRNSNRREAERQRMQDLLAADPFNVDVQREIAERIRQERVKENLQNAWEYHPEGNHSFSTTSRSCIGHADLVLYSFYASSHAICLRRSQRSKGQSVR